MTPAIDLVQAALKARAPKEDRKKWVGENAYEMGVSDESLKNWLLGTHTPNGDALLKLFAHFGPEFHSEIVSGIGHVVALESDVGIVADANALGRANETIDAIRARLEEFDAEMAAPDIELKAVES